MATIELVRQEAKVRWQARAHGSQPVIYLGTASCGRAAGALDTL
jgi:hypothetical protein